MICLLTIFVSYMIRMNMLSRLDIGIVTASPGAIVITTYHVIYKLSVCAKSTPMEMYAFA